MKIVGLASQGGTHTGARKIQLRARSLFRKNEVDASLLRGRSKIEKGNLSKFSRRPSAGASSTADTDELQAIVDRAVREVRSERRIKRKANKA